MMKEKLFKVVRQVIVFDKLNETIYLAPWGDVHHDSELCSHDAFDEYLEECKEKISQKKKIYFLGMGDYLDLYSDSERDALEIAALHESTKSTFEDYCLGKTKKLLEKIKFMKGRMIGMIEGNHHAKFASGMTTTQYMCQELRCQYLGCLAYIRLSFRQSNGSKKTAIDMYVHHGLGAARLIGGSINKVVQMAESARAELFCMGHDHKKAVATKHILKLREGGSRLNLAADRVIFCRTGTFLRGYQDNTSSYAAGQCMPPTDIGAVTIEMTPKRRIWVEDGQKRDLFYIDIHARL